MKHLVRTEARSHEDRRSRTRPPLVDVLFGAVLVTCFLVMMFAALHQGGDVDGQEPDWLAALIVVVVGSSVAWRRAAPEAALAASTLPLGLYMVLDYQGGPLYLTPLIIVFTVATIDGKRRSVRMAFACFVVVVIAGLVQGAQEERLGLHLLYLTGGVAAALLGDAVRHRRRYVAGLRERARYLEESQQEEARRQVAEERLRIARDLHDLIAHKLASISIQSGAGLHVIERHPDQARDALAAVKQTSKEALDELRTTLEVLRRSGNEADPSPGPGLDDLEPLLVSARQAGVPVDLRVQGEPYGLPTAVEVTAYRIIQESLTNVMRHAAPAPAQVTIAYGLETVVLEVCNDGPPPDNSHHSNNSHDWRNGHEAQGLSGNGQGRPTTHPQGTGGGGHGIAGMRERTALVGGEIRVGPRPEGGFRVWARLPRETMTTAASGRTGGRPWSRGFDAAQTGSAADPGPTVEESSQ